MKLFALLDRKAKAYSSFHTEKSEAQACRGFADAVNAKDSVFGKYPEDFALVLLAEVSESSEMAEPVIALVPTEILTAEAVVAMRKV